jgi:Flp pilus assembly protein TadD
MIAAIGPQKTSSQRASRLLKLLALLLALVLLNGCAGSGTRTVGAPIDDRSRRTEQPQATAPESKPAPALKEGDSIAAPVERLALANKPANAMRKRDPATRSLLVTAMDAATHGEWERAQAALERAVKLSPTDSGLWRQLAYTHYRRGDFEQALVIAQRALSLTAGETTATSESWNLIADIENARGNAADARIARQRALLR